MIKLPSTRILMTALVVLLFFIFLVAVLFVTNLSFSVLEQLQQKPDWLIWSYAVAVFLLSMVFGRIIWRLLIVKNKPADIKKKNETLSNNMDTVTSRFENLGFDVPEKCQINNSKVSTEAQKKTALIDQKWKAEFEASPEVIAIRAELEEYNRRKIQQTLYIALFGDISSGKSSLIKALISNSNGSGEGDTPSIETSVIGGTTREVNHYHWSRNDASEQCYILTDMPGLNEQVNEQLDLQENEEINEKQQVVEHDILAAEEVRRAHIVIYLCDGDLTATQFDELEAILLLSKPCIVALNKSDQYNEAERQLIISHIKETIQQTIEETAIQTISLRDVPVLSISAGGTREVIRLTPDGEEQRVQRSIEPDIKALQKQLLIMMENYGVDQLEQLREKSVASMINNKLDELDVLFKHSQSHRLVKSYTNKAMVAAIATISPGTDLLVQGYLGIHMIKDLCKIYDVPANDIDANKLIELIQSRMKKTLPLLLAIAGNGFKAFPGIGTVTGGLMHAVAYGMIFDTLGRSVARTLEVTGELSPALVSDLYKEQLSENIKSRTKDFIKMVLKLRKDN
ncbi:MAG: 50S ribosome-binding GTPase [gamma proteobacterium symbiont of Taylorina sp.]|nr:50S ribosome-binding GTPase [gamma proteobacterium symbiont of Taylorina sp.]